MYIRVTKTVKDRGVLIHPKDLEKTVKDPEIDWYYSPFTYGEDALEYFKEHKNSIKGYEGDVWTNTLYWDLDCDGDFEKVRESAVNLLEYLDLKGYGDGLEYYFSGNKGIHVLLKTTTKFTPAETSAICYNVAMKAGVDKEVFDTTVYNVNRIFRVTNTRHPKSELFKIPLTDEQLLDYSEEEIRKLAEEPREIEEKSEAMDANDFKKYAKKPEPKSGQPSNVVSLNRNISYNFTEGEGDFNPMNCPRGKRRCIYTLENGRFGPGERENALIRLAAYYRGRGMSYEHTYSVLNKALERRAAVYEDLNTYSDDDTYRILKEVFSDGWNGGTYTCRSTAEHPDTYLQSKCDLGDGPCGDEDAHVSPVDVVTVEGLIEKYIEYGNEALKEYPKTGLEWIDKKIRIRPRNFSVINGANGSGKTSLVVNMIKNLNAQEIYHIIFSLDMADSSLTEKLGATFTDYSQRDIERAFNVHTRDEKIMQEVVEALKLNLPYTIFDFTSAVDSRHIESVINRIKKEYNTDIRVAFVDYAGRLIGDHDSEFANSSQNALLANDVAKRTDTHIIYLSQVSRENGDHTTPLRTSRIAKHSGAWEENSTFIINVWRPFGNGLEGQDNYMHLYIAKNRAGSLGERCFWWEGTTGLIRDISQREFRDYKQMCLTEGVPEPYEQFGDGKRESADPRRFHRDPRVEVDEEALDEHEEELPDRKKSSRFTNST